MIARTFIMIAICIVVVMLTFLNLFFTTRMSLSHKAQDPPIVNMHFTYTLDDYNYQPSILQDFLMNSDTIKPLHPFVNCGEKTAH
jgi:hypothetical protein